MKVFIFANSYTANLLIRGLDFLTGKVIDEISLLRENHEKNDFISEDKFLNVVFGNLAECLNRSDIILMLDDSSIPNKSREFIYNYAKSTGKELIKIDNPWGKNYDDCDGLLNPDINLNTPLVLLVNYGGFTRHYNTEIEISKLFVEHGIKIKQVFSNKSSALINFLKPYGMINQDIIESQNRQNADLNVMSIESCLYDYGEKSFSEAGFIGFINPDYIVLNIEGGYSDDDIQDIVKQFKIRCGRDINIVVESNYRSAYTGQPDPVRVRLKKTYTGVGGEIIFNDILSKVSLPQGVVLL